VLLKIVCLLMRWLFSLVVRGDAEKNAELLALRHENAVLRRNAGRIRYEPGDRASSTRLPGSSRDAAGLAPQARRQEIRHQQTTQARPPGDGPEHRQAHRPPGAGEPALGLPPYSRRADQAGRLGRGVHRV